jgi:hypothetical protein
MSGSKRAQVTFILSLGFIYSYLVELPNLESLMLMEFYHSKMVIIIALKMK